MRRSNHILITGALILLAGVIMSLLSIEPYADYVLIAGTATIVLRGAMRARERDEDNNKPNTD